VFNQTDQDNPGTPTTLSLRDDPEPALQKAREQASRERYSGLIYFPTMCPMSFSFSVQI
jgi:hypothetical protein